MLEFGRNLVLIEGASSLKQSNCLLSSAIYKVRKKAFDTVLSSKMATFYAKERISRLEFETSSFLMHFEGVRTCFQVKFEDLKTFQKDFGDIGRGA